MLVLLLVLLLLMLILLLLIIYLCDFGGVQLLFDGRPETGPDRFVHGFGLGRIVRPPDRLDPAFVIALVIALPKLSPDELGRASGHRPSVARILRLGLGLGTAVLLLSAFAVRKELGL